MAQPKTDSTGQIQKRSVALSKTENMVNIVEKMKHEISRALPRHLSADKMVRLICTAIKMNPKLAECEQITFLGAIMQASQLGLWPNTPMGYCYLIPRNNRKQGIVECQLLLGYQGMVELSYRSNRVDSWDFGVIREGDSTVKEKGLNPVLRIIQSDDPERETRVITHSYSICRIKESAFPPWEVLSAAQIAARRSRSSARDNGPWVSDYEAMCKKSAIRALWPLVPKSDEMAEAVDVDDRVDAGGVIEYRGYGLSPNIVADEVDADGVVKELPQQAGGGVMPGKKFESMSIEELGELSEMKDGLGVNSND